MGVEQPGDRLKRNASAASSVPASAALLLIWSQCRLSIAMVSASMWKVRLCLVFVAFTFPDDEMAEAIVICFFLQATADIGIPTSSPLRIPVTAIRERELDQRAKMAFGKTADRVQSTIAGLGSGIGPPWTRDHKAATLAAALVLAVH